MEHVLVEELFVYVSIFIIILAIFSYIPTVKVYMKYKNESKDRKGFNSIEFKEALSEVLDRVWSLVGSKQL